MLFFDEALNSKGNRRGLNQIHTDEVIRGVHRDIQAGMSIREATDTWGISRPTYKRRARALGLQANRPEPDLSAVQEWEELELHSRMRYLRLHPGTWVRAGTKHYKSGFTNYTKAGFQHVVRKVEGGWDHYLYWPEDAEVGID